MSTNLTTTPKVNGKVSGRNSGSKVKERVNEEKETGRSNLDIRVQS